MAYNLQSSSSNSNVQLDLKPSFREKTALVMWNINYYKIGKIKDYALKFRNSYFINFNDMENL